MILLFLACATEAPASPGGCEASVSWDGFAHGFFLTYCNACHSEANVNSRYGAPRGIDFDSEALVYAQATRVRARVLDEGTMPLGGGVRPDDLVLLDRYLSCSLGR